MKSEYGIANSAKIIIHNNTKEDLVYYKASTWYGSSFYNSPPSVIPAGKFGYVLAVHQSGSATGTFNQISYTLKDQILSFGTYSPWSQFYTNNVLVDFEVIKEQVLYEYSTRPVNERVRRNMRLRGRIDEGDSPFVFFSITQQ